MVKKTVRLAKLTTPKAQVVDDPGKVESQTNLRRLVEDYGYNDRKVGDALDPPVHYQAVRKWRVERAGIPEDRTYRSQVRRLVIQAERGHPIDARREDDTDKALREAVEKVKELYERSRGSPGSWHHLMHVVYELLETVARAKADAIP